MTTTQKIMLAIALLNLWAFDEAAYRADYFMREFRDRTCDNLPPNATGASVIHFVGEPGHRSYRLYGCDAKGNKYRFRSE